MFQKPLRCRGDQQVNQTKNSSKPAGSGAVYGVMDVMRGFVLGAALTLSGILAVQAQTSTHSSDDSAASPPVTKTDLRIVRRARAILNSPVEWNRSDTRACPADATTFSIYCALEKATVEVTGDFRHRGAAMQQARFVIDDVTGGRDYHHRLMDYNNDPTTTFADIQKLFRLLEDRVAKQLSDQFNR